jgi:methylated-DNA-[protein]-cysteine S-methyltransferase
MTFYKSIESPLGTLVVTTDGQALTGVYFEGQRHFKGILTDWREADENTLLDSVCRQLEEYFSGKRAVFEVPLSPQGTEFQQAVWQTLQAVDFGERLTYSGLAEKMGRPDAVRAVAAAVGRNPISVVIPCHRIVGKDNSLTGYAGGLARKAALLELENTS